MTFHNGAKVTAQDVKYSLDRIKSIGTGIYTELSAYASSKVISPTKITITLSSPYRTFLDALSRVYILNSALVQAHAGTNQGETWLATHEAGSGPYELTQFVPNESVSVAYFKKYWGGWSGKHVADVAWHYYTNGSSEVEALQSGTVNFARRASLRCLLDVRFEKRLHPQRCANRSSALRGVQHRLRPDKEHPGPRGHFVRV